MLELNNVKKKYKDFELDCTMKVRSGMVVGLIGANGAGKSTAFKAALNLIFKDGGEITIFGKELSELTAKDRERIGVVLADSGVSGYLKVKDVIAFLKSCILNLTKKNSFGIASIFIFRLIKRSKNFQLE